MSYACFIVGIIVFVLGAAFLFTDCGTGTSARKKILCGVVMVAGAAIAVFPETFAIVPTGYTGVRVTFGQVDDAVVQNGVNLKIPFVQDIVTVNNKQQDMVFEGQIWSETSSRTAIYYDGVTVTYQISPEKSAWIYANVSDYQDGLVASGLVSSAVKSSSKALSDDDATNRSLIESLALENLQSSLDGKYGEGVVIVSKVTIAQADFEDSYNEAIASKQRAQLAAEEQAIENQKNIDMAEAEYQVRLKEAQADAEALAIEAEAEAEANRILEASLSDMILRKEYIEKWDGELPEVVAGEEASGIMFSVDAADSSGTD